MPQGSRLVITDSGLGGLHVAGLLLQHLAHAPLPLEVVYVNAVPSDDRGYNAMPHREERLAVFNTVLHRIQEQLAPDHIFVACHSLSVLLPEVDFVQQHPDQVTGMVPLSQALLKQAPAGLKLLFTTPSTHEEGTYTHFLQQHLPASGPVWGQPCPELASAISADASGKVAAPLIREYTHAAWEATGRPSAAQVFLGCTHYAFQASQFLSELRSLGLEELTLLSPNQSAAEALLDAFQTRAEKPLAGRAPGALCYSPYELPAPEQRTLATYLTSLSPLLRDALGRLQVAPDLVKPLS